MGSSPEKFFQAIDQALGIVAEVQEEQRNTELHKLLFEAISHLKQQRDGLSELETDLKLEAGREGGS